MHPQVQSFIQMAEQALAVRNITNEHLRQELAAEKSEKNKVRRQGASRGGGSASAV